MEEQVLIAVRGKRGQAGAWLQDKAGKHVAEADTDHLICDQVSAEMHPEVSGGRPTLEPLSRL